MYIYTLYYLQQSTLPSLPPWFSPGPRPLNRLITLTNRQSRNPTIKTGTPGSHNVSPRPRPVSPLRSSRPYVPDIPACGDDRGSSRPSRRGEAAVRLAALTCPRRRSPSTAIGEPMRNIWLYHKVPQDQEHTQPARREKRIPRGARPLRRPLQLLVPAAHVLRHVLRVGDELVDVRGLDRQVAGERSL